MTIAAGFRCNDGVVLCADTELTVGDRLKLGGEKVWITEDEDLPIAMILTGAGSFPYIRMVRDRILVAVRKDMSLVDLKAVIEREIISLHQNHLFLFPEQSRPQVGLIIGARDARGAYALWSTAETAIVDVEHYECIGSGTELGSYLADVVIGQTPNQLEIPVSLAETLAAYLLLQTKRYIPGCGGDSVIARLGKSGVPAFLEWDWIEQYGNHIGMALDQFWMLLAGGHLKMSDAQRKTALERLQLYLPRRRKRTKR